jgi:putative ABC transport system permease protein
MLSHYLKTALRVLSREKGLAFINILGLSIGLACFCMFLLYAVNEFSFDRFHKNEKDIYRVYAWKKNAQTDENLFSVSMSMPLAPSLQKDLPEVKDYVRVKTVKDETVMRIADELHNLQVTYADPTLFSVFSFPLKHGNGQNALAAKNNLVLSASRARALFGKEDVVGQVVQIRMDNEFTPFVVSAIAEDVPANSTIRFDVLASFQFLETTEFGKRFNNWYTDAFATYVQLTPGSQLAGDAARLSQLHKSYYPDEEKEKSVSSFGLQPIRSIHTDVRFNDSSGAEPVDPQSVWIVLTVAFCVLLIACINFTTLAIARAAGRGKEVGIRKVTGAGKRQLMLRFLSEAFLLTFCAACIGFLLIALLMPWFNDLTGRNLQFSLTNYPEIAWYIAALMVFVALLAGSYPSIILSRFNPVEVLKNKIRLRGSGLFTRSLITVQFALSIGLIVATTIILQQTKHMAGKHPGFVQENVLVIDASRSQPQKTYPLLKQELQSNPAIKSITAASSSFGEGYSLMAHGFKYFGERKVVFTQWVAPGYIKTMGMQLVAGRDFDPAIGYDTVHSVIINEAMAREFGWTPQNAIGQSVNGFTNTFAPTVIGVVKDFTFQPLSKKTEPSLFHQTKGQPKQVFLRLNAGNHEAVLSAAQKAWNRISPDVPFKYSFLDENIDRFYKAERRWSQIIGWAGGISIFLACLGLFGLVQLTAIKRIKEIGIRKILGASIPSIVRLLSADFIKLIVIAMLIATPLTWYYMNQWLQDYAYRVNIQWWIFAVAGLAVIGIALITVCFHTIRAAIANPVKSLRTE